MNFFSYFNNPNIGVFFKLNNEICLGPIDVPKKEREVIKKKLNVEFLEISILHSNIIGIYCAMNDNGIVCPPLLKNEKKILKDFNVYECNSKYNAFGNNLAINNKKGLINKDIPKKEKKKLEDVLGIELISIELANYKTVGSMIVMNDRGFLVSYLISEEEKKELEKILNLKGERGTINMGSKFISLGLIANNHSYLVGQLSSGYEIGKVEEALDFIR